MSTELKTAFAELKVAIGELNDYALDGISYVGQANYTERELEANERVNLAKDNVDKALRKLKREIRKERLAIINCRAIV